MQIAEMQFAESRKSHSSRRRKFFPFFQSEHHLDRTVSISDCDGEGRKAREDCVGGGGACVHWVVEVTEGKVELVVVEVREKVG